MNATAGGRSALPPPLDDQPPPELLLDQPPPELLLDQPPPPE
jgi:hypothetical protein